MTKEQIKALIAAKIAGQGTQVDLGGALPTILDAILDAIPEGGGNEPYIVQGAFDAGYPEATLAVSADEYARAIEAFLAGRVVLIPETEGIAYMATAYSLAAANDNEDNSHPGLCLFANTTGSNIVYSALVLE